MGEVVILDADNNTIETPFNDLEDLPSDVVSKTLYLKCFFKLNNFNVNEMKLKTNLISFYSIFLKIIYFYKYQIN